MELLEGDHERLLSEGARLGDPLSFQDSLNVLLQVAEAMKHLHGMNFVHGDLKPGNILVSKLAMPQFYLVKVADFGCVQLVDSSGAIVGTFNHRIGSRHHVAPEVLRFRRLQEAPPELPQKIDIYSFGIVAYQVLTGLPTSAFEAWKPSDIAKGVMKPDTDKTQWRPNRAFDGILKPNRLSLLPLIERCWSSSPQDRPTFPEICCEIQKLY